MVRVTATKASFTGILHTPNTNTTMRMSCRSAATAVIPAASPDIAENRILIYMTINRAESTMAMTEFLSAFAPI